MINSPKIIYNINFDFSVKYVALGNANAARDRYIKYFQFRGQKITCLLQAQLTIHDSLNREVSIGGYLYHIVVRAILMKFVKYTKCDSCSLLPVGQSIGAMLRIFSTQDKLRSSCSNVFARLSLASAISFAARVGGSSSCVEIDLE